MKHKKLLIVLVVVVLVLVAAAIGNYWDSKKTAPTSSPTPPATEPAPSASATPAPTPVSYTAEELQAAVDAVVPDEYKGLFYSCDVLENADVGGYVASLQIMVDAVPPESTTMISDLEAAIRGLGYDQIASIEIMAFKETQKEIGLVDSNMDLDPSLYKIPTE